MKKYMALGKFAGGYLDSFVMEASSELSDSAVREKAEQIIAKRHPGDHTSIENVIPWQESDIVTVSWWSDEKSIVQRQLRLPFLYSFIKFLTL